ncbi:MAG: acyltransferase [Gallionella sp.]|nr:acyltransferase [Gallionella sp.]
MSSQKVFLWRRVRNKLRNLPIVFYQQLRIWKYKLLSGLNCSDKLARISQPVLIIGCGEVKIGRCNLGVWPSPNYLSGYIHIEARGNSSRIIIEDGVWINNNAVIIAERSSIRIGANTLVGGEFTVVDSDFHDLHPDRRLAGTHECKSVDIGKNVFIGSRVMILKGVNIGDNSVIAAGAVVTRDVPDNCIAAGVPAKVIAKISSVENYVENDI